MHVVDFLKKMKFVPQHRLLELYPPFLFMGVKIKSVSSDYRKMVVHLPLRWYGRNQYGTMFGGFMCAVSDPLPALLCAELFPKHEVWTKSNFVEFLRSAKSGLDMDVEISEQDVERIERALAAHGKTTHVFEFMFRDRQRHDVALCRNSVFIRRRKAKTPR